MATNISTVGATGRDYSKLQTWESATDNDLVSAGDIEVGEIYDDADYTDGRTCSGATTDSSNYRIFRAASGEEFDPVAGTGVEWVKATQTADVLIALAEDWFQLGPGLGFDITTTDNTAGSIIDFRTAVEGCLAERLFVKGRNSGSYNIIFAGIEGTTAPGAAETHPTIRNCIVVSETGTRGPIDYCFRHTNSYNVWNCVAYNGGNYGLSSTSHTDVDWRNNIAVDAGSADFSRGSGTPTNDDYNASSDITATGTNSITAQTATSLFVVPGSDDFRLKLGSNAIDDGVSLSGSFTDDYDGTTRSGTWDMGAYDDSATGGGSTNVTVTPGALAAASSLPAPTIVTGSTITPVALAASSVLPAPTVLTGSNVTMALPALTAAGDLPAPGVSVDTTETPVALAGAGTLPAPTVVTGSTITPVALTAAGDLPAVTVVTSAVVDVTVEPVALAAACELPAVYAGQFVTAYPVVLQARALQPDFYPPQTDVTVNFATSAINQVLRAWAYFPQTLTLRHTVGGSGSCTLSTPAKVDLYDMVWQGSDLIGISFPPSYESRGFYNGRKRFFRCNLNGRWDAGQDKGGGIYSTKWGWQMYDTPKFQLIESTIENIELEHCIYCHLHGPGVNIHIQNSILRRSGRTGDQFISRVAEGGGPAGAGIIFLEGNYYEDNCVTGGGGGSTMTFAGGMVQVDVIIDGCTDRKGCNPGLEPKVAENITGCITTRMERYGSSDEPWKDRGEPKTWYGDITGWSIKSLTITNCDFEIGTVYPGQGSASRQMLEFKEMETLTIGAGNRFVKDFEVPDPVVGVIECNSDKYGYPGRIGTVWLTDPSNLENAGRWKFTRLDGTTRTYGADYADPDGYADMFAAECDVLGGLSGNCFPLGDGP